jgi:DnaA-homolog protein
MQQLLLDLLPAPAASFDNFVIGRNGEAFAALAEWLDDPAGPTCFLLWGERHSGRRHLLAAAKVARPEIFCKSGLETLDESEQIALFNSFNSQKLAAGKLLVSSLQPPAALSVREDLRTRLGSGLIYRLHPLSDEEKRAALSERAAGQGLKLSTDMLDYIFRHVRRDMGTLVALIDALDRFTLLHRKPLTLPLLRKLLQDSLQTAFELS